MSRQISILLESFNLQLLERQLCTQFPNLRRQHSHNIPCLTERVCDATFLALHPACECTNSQHGYCHYGFEPHPISFLGCSDRVTNRPEFHCQVSSQSAGISWWACLLELVHLDDDENG